MLFFFFYNDSCEEELSGFNGPHNKQWQFKNANPSVCRRPNVRGTFVYLEGHKNAQSDPFSHRTCIILSSQSIWICMLGSSNWTYSISQWLSWGCLGKRAKVLLQCHCVFGNIWLRVRIHLWLVLEKSESLIVTLTMNNKKNSNRNMCVTFKHFFKKKKEIKPHSATEKCSLYKS